MKKSAGGGEGGGGRGEGGRGGGGGEGGRGGGGGEEPRPPRVEHFVGRLEELQQGRGVEEEELEEKVQLSQHLQRQLEALQVESEQLDGTSADAAESSRKLQLQCDESQQEAARQAEQNKRIQELLQQHRCDMQELKLKYRKQRMKFEKHLHQLMEQHKDLYSIFSPERVSASVLSAQQTNQQLSLAEEQLRSQLHHSLDDAERQRTDTGK